jgi:ABC-type branched-subunit amino acid transport system ATPase component/ABC-type branched-subunit amino acid transport system permease subunit
MSTWAALAEAAGEIRASWRVRTTLGAAAFVAAAFAPLLFGDARTVDLAAGLYLAAAAVGLALPAGIAGLPCLAQGAFVAVGAVVAAHLLAHGTPTALAALVGGLAGAISGAIVGVAFVRLPRAGFAAATWIVAWLVAFALGSLRWLLGGSEGTVISGGPSPSQHYELALGLTILATLAFAALARSPFGLGLAAARERGPAARALGVPTTRLRAASVAAAGGIAGVSGALAVQLAGVGDPASYGPFLSFKLFVIVLLGGGLAALGPPVGVVVLGVLSLLADALGSLEHVAAARAHELLAAVLLLGVVSLGWDGIVRPAQTRRRLSAGAVPPRPPGRALVATGIGKRFGDLAAAEDVTLSVEPATITVLVGPNGSGKTTVLRMLAGTVAPDAGGVDRPPGGVTRTLQATAVFPNLTPLEHLLVAGASRRRRSGFTRSLFSTPQARAEDAAFVAEAKRVLEDFGLTAHIDERAGELPVSRQRLLMLASASATGASILLVDEPTAGSSAGEAALVIAQLRRLRDEGLGLLVVEHNLGVVRDLADRVIVLDAGRVIADGTPDEVAADDAVRRTYLGSSRL